MVRIAKIGNGSTTSLTVELFPIYAIRIIVGNGSNGTERK